MNSKPCKFLIAIICAPALLLTAIADDSPAFAEIEFIGETFIPFGLHVEGTTVEGLSGLTRIGHTDRYLAICDVTDESPARFYELEIDLSDGMLDDGDVEVVDVKFLADESGLLVPSTYDLEGIALDPGNITLLFASEGVGEGPEGYAPFIKRNSRFGQYINELQIDLDKLDQTDGEGGVYSSGGFESLVYSRNFKTLWAAPETALQQDGPKPTPEAGAAVRLMEFDATDPLHPQAVAEYVYPLSKKNGSILNPGDFGTGGDRSMVDLLPINKQSLLALEREWVGGEPRTNTRPIGLYEIHTGEAENVINVDSLSGDETPVAKHLVLDFDELRQDGLVERVGSFEAMVFGPTLGDGRHSLIFVEDNDSTVDTQVIAFAITPKTCDVNVDGQVTDDDVMKIRQAANDSEYAHGEALARSAYDPYDANGDGYITRRDARICRDIADDGY
jgi:hypothetical protein